MFSAPPFIRRGVGARTAAPYDARSPSPAPFRYADTAPPFGRPPVSPSPMRATSLVGASPYRVSASPYRGGGPEASAAAAAASAAAAAAAAEVEIEGLNAEEIIRARAAAVANALRRFPTPVRSTVGAETGVPQPEPFPDPRSRMSGTGSVDELRRRREAQQEEIRKRDRTVSPMRGMEALELPSMSTPSATGRTDTSITLTWGPAHDNRAEPSMYEVQVCSPMQTWTTITNTLTGSTLSMKGLLPGTPYVFRVRGRGLLSWGSYSPTSEAIFTTGESANASIGAATAAAAAAATGEAKAAAMQEALAVVKREIWAVKHMPAEQARTAVRRLKLRYHPDKAAAEQRPVYEELSKHINTETAGLG